MLGFNTPYILYFWLDIIVTDVSFSYFYVVLFLDVCALFCMGMCLMLLCLALLYNL